MLNFILSEIPVFLLISGKGRKQFLLSLVVFLAVLLFGIYIRRRKHLNFKFEITYPLFSCILALGLGVLFFQRWHTSGRIQMIANLLGKPLQQTAVLISLLLSFLSLVGIDQFLRLFLSLFYEIPTNRRKIRERFIVAFIGLTSLLTMFLNSKCSPFYPFNDWVDPNTMFTVGKGVLKGVVPYRDLYDQKGPLLYFIQTLGAAISYDSFIGIWLVELVCCFFFLYLSYKTAALFFGKKSFLIIPFLSAVIFSPYAFRTGDTGEEFALPLLAYAFFIGFKSLKADVMPSMKEFFIIGLTSGVVFWMKYSMLGFYLGWFLLFLYQALIRKKLVGLMKGCGLILCGIVLWTVPIFIYFLCNQSLDYMLSGYFMDNLRYYGQDYTIVEKMRIGVWSLQVYFFGASILAVIGIFWLGLRRQFKLFVFGLFSFLLSFFVIYYASVRGPYYCLPLGVFTVLGFCGMIDALTRVPLLSGWVSDHLRLISAGALLAGMLFLCFFSDNLKFLEYPREEMFQFQMKEILEGSGIEEPTVYYYNIGDAGVNTVAGLLPKIRYFVHYNFENRQDIANEQVRYIAEQTPDFIIARTKFNDDYPIFDTYVYQGSITGMADQIMQYFHYYTRNDIR